MVVVIQVLVVLRMVVGFRGVCFWVGMVLVVFVLFCFVEFCMAC